MIACLNMKLYPFSWHGLSFYKSSNWFSLVVSLFLGGRCGAIVLLKRAVGLRPGHYDVELASFELLACKNEYAGSGQQSNSSAKSGNFKEPSFEKPTGVPDDGGSAKAQQDESRGRKSQSTSSGGQTAASDKPITTLQCIVFMATMAVLASVIWWSALRIHIFIRGLHTVLLRMLSIKCVFCR